MANLYRFNSFTTFGANNTRPIILGTIIAKTMASEKSTTEFKLDKRVFNVGQDLSSTGMGALELLNMALKKNLEQINNAKPQQWLEPEFPVHPGARVK